MYCWGDSLSDWARPDAYRFDEARAAARDADARASRARGGRTYARKSMPDVALTDPRKTIATASATPLVVAVDVTGSMQRWPFEIFDRLPLLYQTLSQYRPDLEVAFAAIGDAGCDRWPLQVTGFAKGIALEDRLGALYGEGGGGDAPESYQLFAQFMATHVKAPAAGDDGGERPFLIVFGDEEFHRKVKRSEVAAVLGDQIPRDLDGVTVWNEVAARWNTWFLRKPGGRPGDGVDAQWARAIGPQKIVHMQDELRAVDTAMGLIARAWGEFEDFRSNMRARQDDGAVERLANSVLALDPHARDIPDTRTSRS
jgi:hypothetical protein